MLARAVLLLLIAAGLATVRPAAGQDGRAERSSETGKAAAPPRELFTGRVVPLHDALERRGVNAYAEELAGQVVLETPDEELIPILPDWRGRAFYQDERLRERRVELVGYRRPGVPHLQVLMVFTFDDEGQRMYTDYWCDICAIPMYEIQACECCQADIRLRFQPMELPDYVRRRGTAAGAQAER